METERFCVPELLFNPGDIGIDQAGVAEVTWQALQALDQVRVYLRVYCTG
jgi:actin-related protein 6